MSYDLILEGGEVRAFAEVVTNAPYLPASTEVGVKIPFIRSGADDDWVYVNEETGYISR